MFILSLDQGTTSSRAILFDRSGAVRSIAQRELHQIFPRPGWVEHDPEEIWISQREVAVEAMRSAGVQHSDIAAIGIANQRETTIVWDRSNGRPVYNAIVWQDRRTADECKRLRSEGYLSLLRSKTGLLLDPYFSATKIAWILDHVEGARQKAEAGKLAFGTVDSWLLWRLTRGACHATDATNASRTLLFNIHRGEWDPEILELLEIPPALLPEVRSSSEVYAPTAADHFSTPIPIGAMAGDQQAALFGQACFRHGMAKNTYGTGCFMLLHTGREAVPSKNNLLTTIASPTGEQTVYALEGSVFIAGAAIQWLRDGLRMIRSADEVEELARTVDDNGGVYMVPAFAGLGAPHWDPDARGVIAGITRGTTAAHLARAALEGIAFQVADVLDAMRADSGLAIEELRVDGGAARNDLLLQFQSDILGTPIVRPRILETTALGAAYLAGLAVGFWSGPNEVSEQWREERRFEPAMDSARVDELRAGWQKAVERSRNWE